MNNELIRPLSIITDEERMILGGQGLNKTIYTSGKDFTLERENLLHCAHIRASSDSEVLI